MFYWAWRIIKRRPTRYLHIGGPGMLLAALIHLKLMGSPETAHRSIRESGLGTLMACRIRGIATPSAGIILF